MAREDKKGMMIGLSVAAAILVLVTFVASVYGAGADQPIQEKERGDSVRARGGTYMFFYSSGPGTGARGVNGRGFAGGGYGSGK